MEVWILGFGPASVDIVVEGVALLTFAWRFGSVDIKVGVEQL